MALLNALAAKDKQRAELDEKLTEMTTFRDNAVKKVVALRAEISNRDAEARTEQQLVYQLRDWLWYDTTKEQYEEALGRGDECRILYTAPPAPAPVAVKLPDPLMPAQHRSGELFMTPDNVVQGGYLNRDDVLRVLRKAGIKIAEGE